MTTTRVDVQLSDALPRAPWASAPIDLTAFQPVPRWKVFRMSLRETLSELFECQLVIVRREPPPPPDPHKNPALWDELKNHLDNLKPWDAAVDDAQKGLGSGAPGMGGPGDFGVGKYYDAWRDYWDAAGREWDGNPATPNTPGAWENIEDAFHDPETFAKDVLGMDEKAPWAGWPPPDPWKWVGSRRSVRVARIASGVPVIGRYVTGIVSEFEDLGMIPSGYRAARVTIVPSLWTLSLRKDCRRYPEKPTAAPMTTREIVQDVFARAGVCEPQSVRWVDPLPAMPPREHTVQWNETDLDFVLRLFEEEGLVFGFDHHHGEELLIISDAVIGTSVPPVQALDMLDAPQPLVPHGPQPSAGTIAGQEQAWGFRIKKRIVATGAITRDHNFSTYRTPIEREEKAPEPDARYSHYHYPARLGMEWVDFRYEETNPQRRPAKILLERLVANQRVGGGWSNTLSVAAGWNIDIDHVPTPTDPPFSDELNPHGAFLVTSVEHAWEGDPRDLGPAAGPGDVPTLTDLDLPAGSDYVNRFFAVPSDVYYRTPAKTPRPAIRGLHTAQVVVGPRQVEKKTDDWIDIDGIGRILVRFPWDRSDGRKTSADMVEVDPYEVARSCRVRVSQRWAGEGWGTSFVPRAGMEVMVGYVDGDPDRPIALGAVYSRTSEMPVERPHIEHEKDGTRNQVVLDGDGKPDLDKRLHYRLDDKQEKKIDARDLNMIRTRSHIGTKEREFRESGFNELSFDDERGHERVRIHAEGDLTELVDEIHTTSVGNDQINVVQGRHDETVGPEAAPTGLRQELTVEQRRIKRIRGNEITCIGADRTEVVRGQEHIRIGKDRTETVAGKETITVGIPPDPSAGANAAPGEALRYLNVKKHRKTEVWGDDTLTVEQNRDVKVIGLFKLAASKGLTMQQATPDGLPGSSAGVDKDGTFELDAPGENGEISIVAHGEAGEASADDLGKGLNGTVVLYAGKDMRIESGATAEPGGVRFECGDVSMRIGPEGIQLKAPTSVTFQCGPSVFHMEDGHVVLRTHVAGDEENVFYLSMSSKGATEKSEPGAQYEEKEHHDGLVLETEIKTSEAHQEGTAAPTDAKSAAPQDAKSAPAWSLPGILMSGHNLLVTCATIDTSGKGVNIQDTDDDLARRVLSPAEQDTIDDLETKEAEIEGAESRLPQDRMDAEKAQKEYDDQCKKIWGKPDGLYEKVYGPEGAEKKLEKKEGETADAQRELEAAEQNETDKHEKYDDAMAKKAPDDGSWELAKDRLKSAQDAHDRAVRAQKDAQDEHDAAVKELQDALEERKRLRDEKDEAWKQLHDDKAAVAALKKDKADLGAKAAQQATPRTTG